MSNSKLKRAIKKSVKNHPVLNRAVTSTFAAYGDKGALKQVILMRKDLGMGPGKIAAQAAHASVEAVLKSDPFVIKKWRTQGSKKVVLRVDSVEDIYEYSRLAENEGLITAIITDAGRTEIAPGTVTCCAIGPNEERLIDKITGKLKMY